MKRATVKTGNELTFECGVCEGDFFPEELSTSDDDVFCLECFTEQEETV